MHVNRGAPIRSVMIANVADHDSNIGPVQSQALCDV